jgi:hypothetical protein
LAILAVGAALRTVQYLSSTSLWFDELALALNVRDRPLMDLVTRPLELLQSAPAAFLFLVKLGTQIVGVNEVGLRVVPWACGLLSLVLFWRLSVRLMKGPALLGTLALFAVSPGLTWYAGTLKQYSGDVAMTLLLVFMATKIVEEPDHRRPVLYGILGGGAILLSQPGLLTAAVLSLCLVGLELARRRRWSPGPAMSGRPLASMFMLWAAAAALGTVSAFQVTGPETRSYMEVFWERSFLPPLWRLGPFLEQLVSGLFGVFSHFLIQYGSTAVPGLFFIVAAPIAVALLGVLATLRSRPGVALLLLAPILAGLGAASFHLLPLQDRIVLFMGWPVLMFAGLGIDTIHRWRPWAGWMIALLTAGVLPVAVLGGAGPPYRAEETRPVLEGVVEMMEEGDQIYAYYGTRHAMAYYGPELGLLAWAQGGCHRRNPRRYLQEVNAFRGHERVWVVFTHALPRLKEAETILSYLDSIGVRLAEVDDGYDLVGQRAAWAVLYDLSVSDRLESAAWLTYPWPAVEAGGIRDCAGEVLDPKP